MSHNSHHAATFPSGRLESIQPCTQHIRVWLAATGRTYDSAAVEAFVRAHPDLFGRAYEVTLRGYHRWRERHSISDTAEGFSCYIARRHQRWIAASGLTSTLAPCLIGSATAQPCWSTADGGSGAQMQFDAAA
jgi:hypothetical protein